MLIASLLLAVVAEQPTFRNVDDLSWMAGCWINTTPSGTVTEFWLPPAGGTMIGVSRTIAKGKTVEYEFLLLRTSAAGLEYVARPSGQAEAAFRPTRIANGEAVFENPAHDFPTRISYRLVDGGMVATIDGQVNGKPRAVNFNYERGDCSK